MVHQVLRCAKGGNRQLVESAVFRVILGGLIQNAPVDIADELVKVYRETYKNDGRLEKDLVGIVDALPQGLLLATSHTTFGLILGCESPERGKEVPALDSYACLFDFMLCPLVLFHDLPNERRFEKGTIPACDDQFMEGLLKVGKMAVAKLPEYTGQDPILGHVRAQQIQIVRELYLDTLPHDMPDFKKQYTHHLDTFIGILTEGRHHAPAN